MQKQEYLTYTTGTLMLTFLMNLPNFPYRYFTYKLYKQQFYGSTLPFKLYHVNNFIKELKLILRYLAKE